MRQDALLKSLFELAAVLGLVGKWKGMVLNGRYVGANWDVDEVPSRQKGTIQGRKPSLVVKGGLGDGALRRGEAVLSNRIPII